MSDWKKLNLSAIINKNNEKAEKKEKTSKTLEEVTKKEEKFISAENKNISNSEKFEEKEKSHKISISALKEKKEIESKKEILKNEKKDEENLIWDFENETNISFKKTEEIFSNYKSDFDKEINVNYEENGMKSEKNSEEKPKTEEKNIEKETPIIQNTEYKKVKIDNSWEKIAKKENEKVEIITATEVKKEKKSFKWLFIWFWVLASFILIWTFAFIFLNQEKTPEISKVIEIVWKKTNIQNWDYSFEVEKTWKNENEKFRYKNIVYNSKDELMEIIKNETTKKIEEKEKMITQKIKKIVIEKYKD